MEEKTNKLLNLIKESKNIVFFSGAGVSTESGIKDFRSKDGLYNLKSKYGVNYETILSHSFYESNKDTFYKFYREFMINKDATPNACHKFFSELQKIKNVTIITQNIDGLDKMAGSKNVIELHGTIHEYFCESCMKKYDLDYVLSSKSNIPHCNCGGDLKPNVVLYEEALLENNIVKAIIALQNADLLIIGGTSLSVYPAASLINYYSGNNLVVINKEKITPSRRVTLEINDSIGVIFESISKNLF